MSKTATQPTTEAPQLVGIAACQAIAGNGGEIQLTPAGEFRAIDGRPFDAPRWYIDGQLAANVIAAANARLTPYVLDYDHQTIRAKQNGQKAPAAGWFKQLEWREGAGLFATGVEWTAAAQAEIDSKEYRFISPVISYDKKTGDITGILMAALTNYPAIDGMDEATLAAACAQFNLSHTAALTQELPQMEALLEQLRWLLNLPVASTPEDILASLNKLADMIKTGAGTDGVEAANCDLYALISEQRTSIASLTAQVADPDPAKYVEIGVVKELQTQLAALSATSATSTLDEMISKALAENRLMPSMESWARKLGGKDIAALSAALDDMPVIPALASPQTKNTPPQPPAKLTEAQVALCAVMGCSEDDFLANLQAEQKV